MEVEPKRNQTKNST